MYKKNKIWTLYESELKLPSVPDMVFAKNKMIIEHENGGKIEFNALDALKQVGDSPHDIEVAHAKVWQEARSECEFSKKVVKNYDWTFSTSYSGTLCKPLVSCDTDERINLEKLKIPEEILFYKEIFLYEDELDDNGCTRCTVKVRVMPSGFFVVLRHYLRVDHVLIRVNDTRLYHEKGKEGILQETSSRHSPMNKLKVDVTTYKNPDVIWQYLSLIKEKFCKILPQEADNRTSVHI
ncbi:TIP41-like protein [Armadillidium nasatum]|uniref:TIP41-like protein n=1 Tax=Armadillidium nasatum TaxID=96803 RepID=A0A5N5SWI6_9CRUS|nr:TIP41-like protein [Armadillidium nasatum]